MKSWTRRVLFIIILLNYFSWSECVICNMLWWNKRHVSVFDSVGIPQETEDTSSWRCPFPPNSLLSMVQQSLRSYVSGLVSTYGIISSLSSDLLSVRSRWEELRPTLESLQSYLNETGITNELLSVLQQHRSFWIALQAIWKEQRNQRNCQDIRNQVAWQSKWNTRIPTIMEDAYRYVVFFVTWN
jgi:hypothetical protein